MTTMTRFSVPQSMKTEHEELHQQLAEATKAGGRIGEAAIEVARVLHPHFVKEEEYALPPLGLLVDLAHGQVTPDMEDVLAMTDRLKAELPEMLEEHRAIVAALQRLVDAAHAEDLADTAHQPHGPFYRQRPDYAAFAEKLMLHARSEEEVAYPTAILIGEYLKLRLGLDPSRAA